MAEKQKKENKWRNRSNGMKTLHEIVEENRREGGQRRENETEE